MLVTVNKWWDRLACAKDSVLLQLFDPIGASGGIEPRPPDLESGALHLSYTRGTGSRRWIRTTDLSHGIAACERSGH